MLRCHVFYFTVLWFKYMRSHCLMLWPHKLWWMIKIGDSFKYLLPCTYPFFVWCRAQKPLGSRECHTISSVSKWVIIHVHGLNNLIKTKTIQPSVESEYYNISTRRFGKERIESLEECYNRSNN